MFVPLSAALVHYTGLLRPPVMLAGAECTNWALRRDGWLDKMKNGAPVGLAEVPCHVTDHWA